MADKKYELTKAFPPEIEDEVIKVLNIIYPKNKLDFSHCFEVNFSGNKLIIPERIYYDEPLLSATNPLTDLQQIILNCLFTRHHDGFIREKNLRNVIHRSKEYNWVIPYFIRLAGEYVIEILQAIEDNMDEFEKRTMKGFIIDNPKFFHLIESQMVSYWDCYYRNKYPNKEDYVGFVIIKYFHSLLN
jgi:hypothetical protein